MLAKAALACHDRPMAKRIISNKNRKDVNQVANSLIDFLISDGRITPEPPTKQQISAYMAEMGRKGGKVGGRRRLETMSAQERTAIAKRAARARWKEK